MDWTVRGSNSGGNKGVFFLQNFVTGAGDHPHSSGYRRSFLLVKRPGRDVNHSPSSSTKVKNEWSCSTAVPVGPYGVDGGSFTFLGAFAKFRKGTVSLVMSVRPHGTTTRLPLDGFS